LTSISFSGKTYKTLRKETEVGASVSSRCWDYKGFCEFCKGLFNHL